MWAHTSCSQDHLRTEVCFKLRKPLISNCCFLMTVIDGIHRIVSGMEWWLAIVVWQHSVEWQGSVSHQQFMNRHNCHYWASEYPHHCMEKVLGCPVVTVCCRITTITFAGHCFLRDEMNAAKKPWNVAGLCVASNLSNRKNRNTLFHAGWDTLSFCSAVHTWLHDHFPMRWTGFPTAQTWCLVTFFCGLGQEQAYCSKPLHLEQLEGTITNALTTIPELILQSAIKNAPVCLRKWVINA